MSIRAPRPMRAKHLKSCRGRESNPHWELPPEGILSPLRLPFRHPGAAVTSHSYGTNLKAFGLELLADFLRFRLFRSTFTPKFHPLSGLGPLNGLAGSSPRPMAHRRLRQMPAASPRIPWNVTCSVKGCCWPPIPAWSAQQRTVCKNAPDRKSQSSGHAGRLLPTDSPDPGSRRLVAALARSVSKPAVVHIEHLLRVSLAQLVHDVSIGATTETLRAKPSLAVIALIVFGPGKLPLAALEAEAARLGGIVIPRDDLVLAAGLL